MMIPKPDSATLHSIADLEDAAIEFKEWNRQAAAPLDEFFLGKDLRVARSRLLDAGRLTRQRREAANRIEDRGSRFRATLPHPIAVRWRRVQAALIDTDGYTEILECAEAAIAYCAALGLLFASDAGVSPGAKRQLAAHLAGGRRITFGIWRQIVEQLGAAKVPADSPLRHFGQLVEDRPACAIANISARRNSKSHRRGPGQHEIHDAFTQAITDLETILGACEWLVDFPLRHVEASRWDHYRNSSEITFRELMGDHHIVAPNTAGVASVIEVASPYIVDQFGKHLLLRPFLLTRACVECGQLSVFSLDRWEPKSKQAVYLALDHGHSYSAEGQLDALTQVGLLPQPRA